MITPIHFPDTFMEGFLLLAIIVDLHQAQMMRWRLAALDTSITRSELEHDYYSWSSRSIIVAWFIVRYWTIRLLDYRRTGSRSISASTSRRVNDITTLGLYLTKHGAQNAIIIDRAYDETFGGWLRAGVISTGIRNGELVVLRIWLRRHSRHGPYSIARGVGYQVAAREVG
jgi:hypothetical protein